MTTAICTLFEGNYHLGLAALVNSLVANGFKGHIYSGYRGQLPGWAEEATINTEMGFDDVRSLKIDQSHLHFIRLSTDYHFTNYKPDFMLDLWNGPAFAADAMVYLDPDIIVTDSWRTIEKWMDCGVALCEDVNSPVARHHPRRVGWRNYYAQHGVQLKFKESFYVNGGFVGLKKANISFVEDWKRNQELMSNAIGGLKRSSLAGKPLNADSVGAFAPFGKTDQDALNATIESSNLPTSIAGKEVMGFIPGKALLPHALGTPKPWDNKPISRGLNGETPRFVDKVYWDYVQTPIEVFNKSKISKMKRHTRIASLLGRFYSRY